MLSSFIFRHSLLLSPPRKVYWALVFYSSSHLYKC